MNPVSLEGRGIAQEFSKKQKPRLIIYSGAATEIESMV
jgi:hypothetical protein